eukprot:12934929-Prorocentrum_lima.AAC.1
MDVSSCMMVRVSHSPGQQGKDPLRAQFLPGYPPTVSACAACRLTDPSGPPCLPTWYLERSFMRSPQQL